MEKGSDKDRPSASPLLSEAFLDVGGERRQEGMVWERGCCSQPAQVAHVLGGCTAHLYPFVILKTRQAGWNLKGQPVQGSSQGLRKIKLR